MAQKTSNTPKASPAFAPPDIPPSAAAAVAEAVADIVAVAYVRLAAVVLAALGIVPLVATMSVEGGLVDRCSVSRASLACEDDGFFGLEVGAACLEVGGASVLLSWTGRVDGRGRTAGAMRVRCGVLSLSISVCTWMIVVATLPESSWRKRCRRTIWTCWRGWRWWWW